MLKCVKLYRKRLTLLYPLHGYIELVRLRLIYLCMHACSLLFIVHCSLFLSRRHQSENVGFVLPLYYRSCLRSYWSPGDGVLCCVLSQGFSRRLWGVSPLEDWGVAWCGLVKQLGTVMEGYINTIVRSLKITLYCLSYKLSLNQNRL